MDRPPAWTGDSLCRRCDRYGRSSYRARGPGVRHGLDRRVGANRIGQRPRRQCTGWNHHRRRSDLEIAAAAGHIRDAQNAEHAGNGRNGTDDAVGRGWDVLNRSSVARPVRVAGGLQRIRALIAGSHRVEPAADHSGHVATARDSWSGGGAAGRSRDGCRNAGVDRPNQRSRTAHRGFGIEHRVVGTRDPSQAH